jgi:flagellar biosynthesis protein FliP
MCMLHCEADFMLMLCSFSDVVLLLGLVKFAVGNQMREAGWKHEYACP